MPTVYYAIDQTKPNAKPLFKKHENDACWDVFAATGRFVEEYTDAQGKHIPRHYLYGTGLHFAIPKGYHIEGYPRSSLFETGLILANAPTIIDCGYTGEMMAHFYEVVPNGSIYGIGDRIMQIRLSPARYDEVDFKLIPMEELHKMFASLPEYKGRGNNGFGSTGRN